jgi:hypothetical protein
MKKEIIKQQRNVQHLVCFLTLHPSISKSKAQAKYTHPVELNFCYRESFAQTNLNLNS